MNEKQIRDQFKLRLSGVEEGNYCFSMNCDNAFFEIAEISDIQGGCLDLQVEMQKTDKIVRLACHFQGTVEAACDRCLLSVHLPMDFDTNLIVKLVPVVEEGENDDDDDVWVMDENTYELDIFHFVYESIVLALPHRIVHEDDAEGNPTCDPQVMETLDKLHQSAENSETDPRWDALKNLKLD